MWYMTYHINGKGRLMDKNEARKPMVFSGEHVSGRDLGGSSLMPMLVVGLVLIAIGYAAVMIFV